MLYKNKFINHTNPTYICEQTTNDVEWYVYGSASDGRVATVYPRFRIQDNEFYDNNFEDDPPSLEVAYNTEMISNTFTSNAESADITGIETHRHLGEKRYEIKDHLGNVRAVTSDIKNASNYNLVASSWKFLADLKSMSNYFPYGSLIDEGSWSGNDYNFGYNGMLKEGIGKDISHTHFRNLSSGDYVGWWSPDPKPNPSISSYASMELNPIRYNDIFGDTIYSFTEDGYFDKIIDDGKEKVIGRIELNSNSENGNNTLDFEFNDIDEDRSKILNKETNLQIISEYDINLFMKNNGTESYEAKNSPYTYIERESRPKGNSSILSGISTGKLDHVSLLEHNTLYVVLPGESKLSLNNIVAYNNFDFGNFLWGKSANKMGFPYMTIVLGSQLNNMINGRSDNPGLNVGIFDSYYDQKAIRNGFNYNGSYENILGKKNSLRNYNSSGIK